MIDGTPLGRDGMEWGMRGGGTLSSILIGSTRLFTQVSYLALNGRIYYHQIAGESKMSFKVVSDVIQLNSYHL